MSGSDVGTRVDQRYTESSSRGGPFAGIQSNLIQYLSTSPSFSSLWSSTIEDRIYGRPKSNLKTYIQVSCKAHLTTLTVNTF